MPKSIAQLATELAAAKAAAAAGDLAAAADVVRIRGELHNHPSTRRALRALDGAASATLADVRRGRRARA